jgi:hypothetical protein
MGMGEDGIGVPLLRILRYASALVVALVVALVRHLARWFIRGLDSETGLEECNRCVE